MKHQIYVKVVRIDISPLIYVNVSFLHGTNNDRTQSASTIVQKRNLHEAY